MRICPLLRKKGIDACTECPFAEVDYVIERTNIVIV